ncbi:hypothetical protein PIROE2DRAFT_10405 [Piromyces sp. E2]|nr:hypothetical protein PIROE2DRAFT_10405 [Piromyces sp. E2]|eukprot:OUM63138.1 hypothetical protein PIROE2DRAFT_10405 [Piromyces sp. E2]
MKGSETTFVESIPYDLPVSNINHTIENGYLKQGEIPNSVTTIGSRALTSITIPDSVETIDIFAFGYCTNLKSVIIGNSVKKIESYAFYGCYSLNSVIIGEKVNYIRNCAFEQCTSLNSVTYLGESEPSYGNDVGSVFKFAKVNVIAVTPNYTNYKFLNKRVKILGDVTKYFINADDSTRKSIMICNNNGCTAEDKCTDVIGKKYFIDGSDRTKIIICTGGGTCESNSHGGTDDNPTHYLDPNKRVITCNESGCFNEDAQIKGYFVNADSTDKAANKHIIKCEAGTIKCSVQEDVTNCSGGMGSIRYTSDSDIKFCISGIAEDSHESIITTNESYKYFDLGSGQGTKFPGNTDENDKIVVKVGKGAAILMEQSGLQSCISNDGNYCGIDGLTVDSYCIHSNSKIYKAHGEGCTIITGSENLVGSHTLFFNSDNKKVDVTGAALNIYGYRCEFQGSGQGYALNECVQVRGFVIDNGNIVRCNGWRREGCTITTVDSSATTCIDEEAEGDSNEAGTKICFGTSTSIDLPINSNTIKHIAFAVENDANTVYGLIKGAVTVLSLSSTYAELCDYNSNNDSYFVNYSNPSSEDAKGIIKCGSTGCSTIVTGVTSTNTLAFYIDGEDNRKIITCTYNGECISTDECDGVTGKKYFIDSSDSSKIITCTGGEEGYCTSGPHKGANDKPKYFIDGSDAKKIITCNSEKCSSENKYKSDTLYFIDGGDASDKSIIICDSNECKSKDECNDSITKYFIDGGNTKKIITCNDSKCTTTDVCTNANGNKYYVDHTITSNIITCTGGSTCISGPHGGNNDNPTHYLSPDKKVITCNGSGCFNEDAQIKGYFVNADSTDKAANKHIIKCEACTIKCTVQEDVTNCSGGMGSIRYTSDSDIKFCISDKDKNSHESIISTTETYKYFNLGSGQGTKFPGNTDENDKIVVKVGKGAAILMEQSGLQSCTSNSGNYCGIDGLTVDSYCIYSNGQIYKAHAEGCTIITGSENLVGSHTLFFNSDNKKVDVTGAALNIYGYRCEFQGSGQGYALNECVQVRGFVIDNGNIVRCNDSSAMTCIDEEAEGDNNGAGTKICFGTTEVTLANEKYFDFVVKNDANTIYGLIKGTVTILSLSSTSAKPFDYKSDSYFVKYSNPLSVDENAKGIIKCGSGGCEAIVTGVTSTNTLAFYFDGGNNRKIITCTYGGECVSKDECTGVTGKKYFIDSSDSSKIITCTRGEEGYCTSGPHGGNDTSPKYFIDGSDSETKSIITCNDNGCLSEKKCNDSVIKYFIDGGNTKNIITCNGSGCMSSDVCTGATGNKYYVDHTITSNIIICTGGINCISDPHGGNNDNPTHYLNPDKKVITCNESGCFNEDAQIKGYFVNADSTDKDEGKHIIKCKAGTVGCEAINDSESCSEAKIKYTKNGDNDIFVFCSKNDDDSNAVSIISSTEEYKWYELSTGDVGKGAAILMEQSGLQSCASDSGNYCGISGLTVDSYSHAEGCTAITGSENLIGSHTLFFNSDNKKVDVTGAALNVYGYHCEFDNSENNYALNNCVQARGFAIADNKIVRCNGWRREGCTVTDVVPSKTICTDSGAEGDSNEAGTKICFGTSTSIDLPTDSTTIKHIAFSVQGEVNTIFGFPKYRSRSNEGEEEVGYLTLTSSSVLLSSHAIEHETMDVSEEEYFLNYSNPSFLADSSKCIIKCGNAKECETFQISGDIRFFVDAENTKNIITCTKGSQCVSDDKCTNAAQEDIYYPGIDGIITCVKNDKCSLGNPGENYYLSESKVITCPNTCQFVDEIQDDGIKYYLSHTNSIITCTRNGCDTSDTGKKGYFVNAGNDYNSKPFIKCDGTEHGCSIPDGVTSCKAIGNAIYANENPRLCIATGNDNDQPDISASTEQYLSVILADAADFPGNSGGEKTILSDAMGLKPCVDTTIANCKMSESTYCISLTSNKIYKDDSSGCTMESIASGSLVFFRQEGDLSSDVFTMSIGEIATTDSGVYAAYEGGEDDVVTLQRDKSFYVTDTLMSCDGSGKCHVPKPGKDGDMKFYHSTNTKKMIRVGREEVVVMKDHIGIYDVGLSGKIIKCTGSPVECVEEDLIAGLAACDGTDKDGKFYIESNVYNICKYDTKNKIGTGTLILRVSPAATPDPTSYRKLSQEFANLAFGVNENILMKVDGTEKYAIIVDAKAGYYNNADVGSGYPEKALIYCDQDGIDNCEEMTATSGYYKLGGSADSASAYIQCSNSACTEEYFDTYDTCEGSFKGLPECDQITNPEVVCREGAAEGEVCWSTTNNKFYESGRGFCFEYQDIDRQDKLQYFNQKYKRVLPESTVTTEPIIYECTPDTDGVLRNCELNEHELPVCENASGDEKCREDAKEGSYCVNTGGSVDIFVTTGGKCKLYTDDKVMPDGRTKHFYFDKEFKLIDTSGSTDTTKIYASKPIPNTCTKMTQKAIGELIRTPTSVAMCLPDGKSMSLLQTEQEYLFITTTGTEFADVAAGTHRVKTTGKSIIKVGDAAEGGIPTCKTDGTTGAACQNTSGDGLVNACISSSGGKLYVSVDGSTSGTKDCVQLTHDSYTSVDGVIHFARDYTLANSYNYISTVTADSILRMAYKCSFDADKKASGCEAVSGYAVDGNFLVSCSNQAGDDCTVVSKGSDGDCQAGEGIFNSGGGSLCFGTRKVALSESGTKYVAFKATASHNVFNKAASAIVMLELGKDYAVVMNKYPDTSKTLYFVNEANPKINSNGLSEPLIKIVIASNVVDGASEAVPKGNTMPGEPTYYLGGSSDTSVIKCTYEGECESIDTELPESGSTLKKYFIAAANNKVIRCGPLLADKCAEDTLTFTTGSEIYYFIDEGDETGKSVLKCVEGDKCTSIKNVAGGYFISSTSTAAEKYIKCNGSAACTYPTTGVPFTATNGMPLQESSSKIQYLSASPSTYTDVTDGINSGYEKLSAGDANTIFGSNESAVVEVRATSIMKVNIAVGYYKRVGITTGLEKTFVYCQNTTAANCEVVDATDGYYLSATSKSTIIKCLSTGCTETPIVYSSCEVGGTLPTCTESAASVSNSCIANAVINSVCRTSAGALLITTSSTSCAALTGVAGTYNFDENNMLLEGDVNPSDVKKTYTCSTGGVGVALNGCLSSAQIKGGVINTSGNVPKVCMAANDATAVSITDLAVGYHGIEVAAVNNFPGAEAEKLKIDIKVTGKNSIVKIPYKEAELGVCTNTGGSGTPPATTGVKYKINQGSGDEEVAACRKTGANKEIHYTNGSDCKTLTSTGQTTVMYYFKKDYEKIELLTATSQISYAYRCTFGGSSGVADQALTSCAAVYGYTVSGDVAVACSGVVGSECVVHNLISSCTATSGDATLGKSGDRYFLCFGTNKYELPTGTDTDVVAFASDNYHEGLGSYGVTFLKLTKDIVTVDASSFTASYRVNPSATGLKKALIYCATANTLSSCTIIDAVNGYYKSALGNEYVIRCDGSSCKGEKVDHTTCGYDTLLQPCTNIETGKQCIEGAAAESCCIRDGVIYKNAANSCVVLTVANTDAKQKLYFTAANVKTETAGVSYYECDVDSNGKTVSGCTVTRDTLPTCARGVQGTSKCVDNAGEGAVCITSTLTGFSNSVHYFDNSNTEITLSASNINTVRYVYKCTSGSSGTEASALSGCSPIAQTPGSIIKSNDGPKICVSGSDAEAITVGGNTAYKKITVNANSFPGVSDTTLVVKVTGGDGELKSGVVEMKDEASLPTCASNKNELCMIDNTTTVVDHCITGDVVYENVDGKCVKLNTSLPTCDLAPMANSTCQSSGGTVAFCRLGDAVYRTNGNKCVALVANDELEQFSYYDRNYASVDPESNTNVYYAYQCRFNAAGVANACMFARGVTTTATKSVYCNGWKNDICTVKDSSSGDSSCSSGVGGITTNAAGICIGSNAVEFPKDGFHYAAFTTSELNRIYGVKAGQVVLLKLTPNAALLTEYTGMETIYLLDQANTENDDDKKPLIRCTEEVGCISMASATKDKEIGATEDDVQDTGIVHVYYVDGAFPNGEQIITCEQSIRNAQGVQTQKTCSSAPAVVDYYVDSVRNGLIICDTEANPTGFGLLPTCENEISADHPCITNTVNGSCVSRRVNCIERTVLRVVTVKTCKTDNASTFGLYYTGGSVANEKIIVCDEECEYRDDVTACAKDEEADHEGEILYEDNVFKICDNKEKRVLNTQNEGYMLLDLTRAKEIFPGATADMLIENKCTAMVEENVKDGYYYNVENPAGTVIKCIENDGCAVVTVEDKYYIHDGNKLPICMQVTEATEKCITDAADDSHCIKDRKLYRNSSGDNKCTEITAIETCSVETISENAACTEGSTNICIKDGKYYISDNNHCTGVENITIKCEQIKSGKKCVADAESNALCRRGNDIYKSTDNDCEFVATTLDLVSTITLSFKEDRTKATNVDDIATVYKCTQHANVLSNCILSEREPGEIVYTASNTNEICKNTNGESQSITSPPSDPYLSIYTEIFDAFPGNTLPGVHVLYFSKYRSVLMKQRATLPPCDVINTNQIEYIMTNDSQCHSNGYPVKYCLMNNNEIYQSTSNSCDMMSEAAGSTAFYFFANANKQIEEVDIYSHVEFVYKCRFGVGEVKRCKVMKGYVITNNHIVNCNGWEDCTVTPLNSLSDTCTDTREGQLMGNGAAVCITESQSISLPTDSSTKYVMFQAGPTSPYYGQHQGKPILLALTTRSATVVDGGKEVKRGYYQNIKVSGAIENALVFCAKDGDMESCHVVNGLNGYYLSQDSDRDTFPVIRCERYLGCRKQSVDVSCNGNGSLSKSGSTITICGASTTLSTSAISVAYKSLARVDTAFPGVIEENMVVVKFGKDGSALLLEDGIHLNENVSGVVEKAVYKCTTSTNGITSTCTASNAGYGYYRNAGSTGDQDQFLACSINGRQAILVDANAMCDLNSVGGLVGSSPTLCLNFNSSMDEPDGIEINNDISKGTYMVAYNLSNIFGLEEDNYAYVDVDSESVLLKNNFKSYVYTDGQKEDIKDLYPDADKINKKYEFKYVDYGIYELICEDDDERELCSNE